MEEDEHAREQALERELVDRAAKGDQRAFRMLVDRYQRRAYGVAYGILRDPDQAMDVAQGLREGVHQAPRVRTSRRVLHLAVPHRREPLHRPKAKSGEATRGGVR